ncbi:MAG: alcohol dehydrogenase family protein [Candidatus Competibacterales bacterium]
MTAIRDTMHAVLLMGHGGLDQLVYRDDVPVPRPKAGEVLVQVKAAAINNTDINTRVGWYSKAVVQDTNTGGAKGFAAADNGDASWAGAPLRFPRIQGIDVCGHIYATGADVDPQRVGERVLVEPCLRIPLPEDPQNCWFLGSECDGGFAQFVAVPAAHAHQVTSPLSDVELASFPCAYSTAENMLTRADLKAAETVLITGASGGVGSAAIQLAKRRGARVIAVAGTEKHPAVRALGAETVLPRGVDLEATLGDKGVDVVVDLVAGPQWPGLLAVLKGGGRYAVAGAIAGPVVTLDIRTLYLKDLSFFGCARLEPQVFPNLIGYIERGDIRPVVAKRYPLEAIHQAQRTFLAKQFTGKLVLVPPPLPQ